MPQSRKLVSSAEKLVSSAEYLSPVSWIGAIVISLLLWSFLIWCIWRLSIGLF
jgi:hypothetical protein